MGILRNRGEAAVSAITTESIRRLYFYPRPGRPVRVPDAFARQAVLFYAKYTTA
jgi:hypothetical protein